MIIEAKRSGIVINGKDRVIIWIPCHLGRKPRSGGSLAKDRSIVARANLIGGVRAVREVIFWEVRFIDRNDSITIVVVVI